MKVPYELTAAMGVDERHIQMAHSVSIANSRGYPRLQSVPIDPFKSLSIACYGPSLEETWQNLTPPILSMSGATRFLADHGVTADYHIDMDPRPYKAKHLTPPIPGVHYLMASVCPPETWDQLKDERVTLWHVYSGVDKEGLNTDSWVAQHDHGQLVLQAGSTIGLTAMHVGGLLGYRHFEIHGMDGSFAETRHAGVHFGKKQKPNLTWDAEGVTYRTSKIMANAVAETINNVKHFPMFCVFHGTGLTQALIREANYGHACTANQTEKADRVRRSFARFLDMPQVTKNAASYWDVLMSRPDTGEWLTDVLEIARQAERRRELAKFKTGTIPVETALLLRGLCRWIRPRIVVELGTFIGTSTLALEASEHLYTVDRDNDCLSSTETRTCHPGQSGSQMFDALIAKGVKVDLFFFDGRLQEGDVHRVLKLSHPHTVYTFDDYNGKEKGVVNLGKMATMLPNHAIVEPYRAFEGRSTLAALVPMGPPS